MGCEACDYLKQRLETVRDGARGLFELREENEKTIKQLEQQNAKLIECLESLLDYGHTGEDAVDMQMEAQQTLSEVKGE